MTGELSAFAQIVGIPIGVLITIIIWSLVWKISAMWKAARNNSLIWFVILAVINTLGFLEILYIFIFSKMKCCDSNKSTKRPRRIKRRK